MQQQGPGQRSQNGESSGQSSGQSGGASKASRTAGSSAKRPRTCAAPPGRMRRQDSQQAANSGSRAPERLRELERQIQTAKPDDRRRALGDLQLETRQLADAQRRLNNEAGRTDSGASGDDARRRLAGEQERLADRADRLQDQVKRMSRAGQSGDERKATHRRRRVSSSVRNSLTAASVGRGAASVGRWCQRSSGRTARPRSRWRGRRRGCAGARSDRRSASVRRPAPRIAIRAGSRISCRRRRSCATSSPSSSARSRS